MALYKSVLHHYGNTLDKSFLETLGVWVSRLNGCDYCVEHHFAGLKRLLKDEARSAEIRTAIDTDTIDEAFTGRERQAMSYARKLACDPASMIEADVIALKEAGLDDGEILEINQVIAYFCYANRTVLGLGINHTGEKLGLSPGDSNSPDDWSHA